MCGEAIDGRLTPKIVSCARYAEAVRHFLAARDAGGAPYIRSTDRFVGVGHSLGGCTAYVFE